MSTHEVSGLTPAERDVMTYLRRSLPARFPGQPAGVIEEQAATVLREYRGCRVRAFLPILVEREVRDRLGVR